MIPGNAVSLANFAQGLHGKMQVGTAADEILKSHLDV